MKTMLPVLPAVLLLAACAGDNGSTNQSAQHPPRSAHSTQPGTSGTSSYARGRVYVVTRPGTADQPRGEWRAMGESIREQGSTINFVELGSGRAISFTAPHQITRTNSVGDRSPIQGNSDNPNDVNQIPGHP